VGLLDWPTVDIRLIGGEDVDAVVDASALFDGPARRADAARFLRSPGHFIFLAYDDDAPVGFVSGVEMTHPDKGTEMFLYELAVAEPYRRRGIGVALVGALRDLARARGCYDMWVLTDADNVAALAAYRSSGSGDPSPHVMVTWDL
jgi:ribosomal protein S18 acetylase RimI-like enzyme